MTMMMLIRSLLIEMLKIQLMMSDIEYENRNLVRSLL